MLMSIILSHTVMFELTIQRNVINNTDETKEEQEGFSSQVDTDSDDFPQCLLSYFETSKSRAAVCEKLILQELEDLTASHHTEHMTHFPLQPQQDTMKLKEQVICDSDNQQNDSSTDTHLLPAETEALFTYDVSVRPDNEGDYTENENRLALEYEAEREKERCEERKKEEQKRRIERDFQTELKKIMEAEKLQQKELELMEKRAQEKLDQEMMLQREVIRDVQRRVEEERRMREEGQKRTRKEDEIRRKKDEEWRQKGEEQRDKREREHMRREEEVRVTTRKGEDVLMKKKKKRDNIELEVEEEERKNKEEKARDEEARKKETLKDVVSIKGGGERNMKEDIITFEEDEMRKEEGRQRERRQEAERRQEDKRRRQEEERKEERRQEEERKEERRQEEERRRQGEDEVGCKGYDVDKGKMESKGDERKSVEAEKELKEEIRLKGKEPSEQRVVHHGRKEEQVGKANELHAKSKMSQREKKNMDEMETSTSWTSSGPPLSESPISADTVPQLREEGSVHQTSMDTDRPSTASVVPSESLTERRRLDWMKDCIPWSKLSLQNRRKQRGSVRRGRGPRGVSSLPPICPDSLLRATGCTALLEVTTVTLQDLPGCSVSSLSQCTRLQSLTLRRCGLKSLEGLNQLTQLCYIDVQENDISFVDCENMTSLRVLRLGHNKLTSIHGLTGAENVDVLDLSNNSITRIAGLESMKRLQRLSLDHNQLISTRGLRDVYTLLHLNCSHNHLVTVEGLENSALLCTLDLSANSLTEPPSLSNQVLLSELHLQDNSISSLQSLSAAWMPLLQQLSVAQNRVTQLPSMSGCVSLANLDLRFNCLSEPQNVCESLEGCHFLREVQLTGNPLQQERGWRSAVQKALPGLRSIDGQQTDSSLAPPAVPQLDSASGSFLMFCQAQLQQTQCSQQQLSRELSNASSSLDAVKSSCRHFTEALQLAEDQRYAHEYGDTTVTAGATTPEETLGMDSSHTGNHREMESAGHVSPVLPNGDNTRCSSSSWTFEDKCAAEIQHNTFNTVATHPNTGPTVREANSESVHPSTTSSNLKMAPVSNHEDLNLQRQKSGNVSRPSTAEEGGGDGDGGEPESGPAFLNGSVVAQHYAASVIQAFWKGFSLRRRLASALAAVTRPDAAEDDTFEEVDVDEFDFDEAALEKQWTLSLPEDSPPRRCLMSDQPLSLKPPVHFPEASEYILSPPPVWRPKQAWVPPEQTAEQRVSPESSNRSKSPASVSVLSRLSERSEKIIEEWGFTHSHTALQMLKRARKMKSTKQQQSKRRDPFDRHSSVNKYSYQLGPVEARSRPTQHNRIEIKVAQAELELQQAEKVERVKQQQRAQQWLQTQAARSDRGSESVHFLPEISSDILNGGRVQLVADLGSAERHASGSCANNSLAAQPCNQNDYPRRNSLGHARKEVPSPPPRVTSAPSKKERMSFRDNPVVKSGGWGGGKKFYK